MSHRHYINETKDSLRNVIIAQEMVDLQTREGLSPFKSEPWVFRLQKIFSKFFIKLAEKSSGLTLYTDNQLHELASVDPKIRSILLRYIKNGFIRSWTIDVVTQVKSFIVGITIEVNNIETEDGWTLKLLGASGCGTGYTINQAFIPAIAELVERHSSALFSKKDLLYGSQKDFLDKKTIDLEHLHFFTKKQKENHSELNRNKFDEYTKMHWKHALEITTNKKVLIPAQLCYIFLSFIHKEEPIFFDTNSNGTASHTNKNEARFRALAEIIERDAFLHYWLQQKKPRKISKSSIKSSEIKNLIRNFETQSFKLEILDMTTELGVPVIVSVIYGSSNRHFVSIGASCDFNIENALRKSLFEAGRVAQFFKAPTDIEVQEAIRKYPYFTTFRERYAWWTIPENQKHIQFLLSGSEINYAELEKNYKKNLTSQEKLETVKSLLMKNKIEAYLVDITSKEAKSVGLCVQKAIVPQLIPAYFKEYSKPLNLDRIKSIYSVNDDLNPIPHPFL